jgi:hypothetical protein
MVKPMQSDFQTCHDLGRYRVGERGWGAMTTHDRATIIYEELRKLDQTRVQALKACHPDPIAPA